MDAPFEFRGATRSLLSIARGSALPVARLCRRPAMQRTPPAADSRRMGPTLSRRPVCTGSRGRLPPLCPAWLAALLLAIVPFLAGRASAGSRLPAEPGPSTSDGAAPAVALQPLGDVDPALVRAVADAVRQTFAVRDTVLAEKPLPQAAFYRARRRYRGEQVLRRLEAETPARFDKVLGLMS